MTDRDKLDTLVRQRMAEREEAVAENQRNRALILAKRQSQRTVLDELWKWCEDTFAGYQLPETGHELSVSKTLWSSASNIHVYFGDTRLAPWMECIGLSINHCGPETFDERSTIVLLLVRAVNDGFEVITEDASQTVNSVAAVHDQLMKFVADFGAERLRKLFEKLSRGKFSPKS